MKRRRSLLLALLLYLVGRAIYPKARARVDICRRAREAAKVRAARRRVYRAQGAR